MVHVLHCLPCLYRHPALYGLLSRRDTDQQLILLATLSAWVVADGVPPAVKQSPAPAAGEVTARANGNGAAAANEAAPAERAAADAPNGTGQREEIVAGLR